MINREISNNNLYLILPAKVSRMAGMYADDFRVGIQDALQRIYSSSLYAALEREETKLWHLGPVALYQMFLDAEIR